MIFTNRAFLDEHPTAAEDFLRATMRGLADAIADPAAAAAVAVERINGNGNPNFLSPEGETFRWATDAETDRCHHSATAATSACRSATSCSSEVDAYADVGCSATRPRRRRPPAPPGRRPLRRRNRHLADRRVPRNVAPSHDRRNAAGPRVGQAVSRRRSETASCERPQQLCCEPSLEKQHRRARRRA